jgi:hypothetical protein
LRAVGTLVVGVSLFVVAGSPAAGAEHRTTVAMVGSPFSSQDSMGDTAPGLTGDQRVVAAARPASEERAAGPGATSPRIGAVAATGADALDIPGWLQWMLLGVSLVTVVSFVDYGRRSAREAAAARRHQAAPRPEPQYRHALRPRQRHRSRIRHAAVERPRFAIRRV